jgi:cytochrome c oxidase subunit 4
MSVYLNGKPVEHPHENHHHVSPVWQFTAVFVTLLILTVITYLVSFAGLGAASLPVAMTVAAIKASLVIAFFMHLFYEDRVYAFMFLSCFIFVAIFFTFTLFDMSATDEMNEESGIHYKRAVDDSAERADQNQAFDAPAPAKPGH